MRVETLDVREVSLVAEIDRSEHVEVEYSVRDGRLTERPVTVAEIPSWDVTGDGPGWPWPTRRSRVPLPGSRSSTSAGRTAGEVLVEH